MKRLTTRAWRGAAVVAVGLMAFGLASVGEVAATPSPKVGICHATSSHSNPYNANDVDTSSVDELNNKYLNGHGDHTGPIWYPGITVKWGDIIPPFTSPDGTQFPGYNWPAGQAILEHGCEIPDYQPEFGAIEVTKVVAGAESHEVTTFQICITPVGGTPVCKDVVGAGVVLFDDLQPGAYAVTETDPGEHWTVAGAPTNVTVSAGDIQSVTITNTRTSGGGGGGGGGGGRGQIWVTKAVDGAGAPSDARFEICIAPVVAEPTARAMGEDSHSHEAEACKTVAAGGIAKFTGLAFGQYVITETDPGLHWDVTGSGVTVTVDRAGMSGRVTRTITNTWAPRGELRVTKVVDAPEAQAGATFVICVEPAATPGVGRVCFGEPVGDDGVATFHLRPGEYRVVEPDLPYGWNGSVNPTTVTVVALEVATATVTNTWAPPFVPPPIQPPTTGSVLLTKVVEGTPAEGEDIDGTFELCLVDEDPLTADICRDVTTADGEGSVLISGLAPGTYTVTETDPGDGFVVDVGDGTVTVVAGGLDTAIVTNTILTEDEEPVIPPVNPPDDDEDSDSGGPVPTPPTGALPHTGIELTLALIATATLGAGALLLTVARRRPIR